ncbi:MAG: hypothetical protein F4X54_00015 [Chloroflexi bacterium]|nr:hypothetical protein [Chloroflexota bacterium]
MPQYVPILKSREGEYWAWLTASPAVHASSRPVFEIQDRSVLDRDLAAFVRDIAKGWPQAVVLTVDTSDLNQKQPVAGTTDRAVLWTARALRGRNVAAKPVMRLDDDPLVLQEVASAAQMHGLGACLRLGSSNGYPTVASANILWPRVQKATGLRPAEVDLLIDLWAVQSPRAVTSAAAVAIQLLHWAHQQGSWRSVTVASGAFPDSISNFPYGNPTAVHRYDANFYTTVVGQNPPIVPDYGDYGIWHPALPLRNVRRGPNPNLRYTDGREWQVYREPTTPTGNDSFYTICANVVGSSHWPTAGATYSRGDAEIYRRAQNPPQGGAGRATEWLRWGASHHFAHVVERLSNLGEP